MTKWAEDVEKTYNEDLPEYIQSLTTPFRLEYPTERMAKEEIITSLAKVESLA